MSMDKVSRQCIVCYAFHNAPDVPAEIHHLRTGVGMGQKSKRFIGLCPEHHRLGGYGVAFHAGKVAFEERYASEDELWETTQWLLEQTH